MQRKLLSLLSVVILLVMLACTSSAEDAILDLDTFLREIGKDGIFLSLDMTDHPREWQAFSRVPSYTLEFDEASATATVTLDSDEPGFVVLDHINYGFRSDELPFTPGSPVLFSNVHQYQFNRLQFFNNENDFAWYLRTGECTDLGKTIVYPHFTVSTEIERSKEYGVNILVHVHRWGELLSIRYDVDYLATQVEYTKVFEDSGTHYSMKLDGDGRTLRTITFWDADRYYIWSEAEQQWTDETGEPVDYPPATPDLFPTPTLLSR